MKLHRIFLYLSVLLYCILATLYLSTPGLNSDEMLFGNAAQGLINKTTHHSFSIKGFPVMLMPYIGALKSYIYFPIFYVFGVSVWSVRIPMIILTAFSLFINAKTIALTFGKSNVYIFSVLLLATNTCLVSMTRTDIGPVAIEFFLKSLCTYLTISFLIENKTLKLYFLIIFLFLGAFNKLNFIWFFNSLYAGIVFYLGYEYFFERQIEKQRNFKIIFIPLGIGLFLNYSYYVILNKTYPMLGAYFTKNWSLTILQNKLSFIYYLVKGNFNGSIFYSYQYEDWHLNKKFWDGFPFPSTNLEIYTKYCFEILAVGIILYFFFLFYQFIKNKKLDQKDLFFIFFFINIIVQLIQTLPVSNANHSWHFFTIYPFFIFCTAITINQLKLKSLKYFVFFILILININGYSKFLSSFSLKSPKGVWSTAIYDLIDYTSKSPATFVCVTWGVEDQLVTFNKKDKFLHGGLYPDYVFQGQKMYQDDTVAKPYFSANFIENKDLNSTYYIVSWEENIWFKNYSIFQKATHDLHLKPVPVKAFFERGKKIYTIFKLEKKSND